MTVSYRKPSPNTLHNSQLPVRCAQVDWVSDASGDYSEDIELNGELLKMVSVPDSGGTQPSNNYDVTLVDESAIDVLEGYGANVSNAAAAAVVPYVKEVITTDVQSALSRPILAGTYTFTVANGGNAKGGTALLYYR